MQHSKTHNPSVVGSIPTEPTPPHHPAHTTKRELVSAYFWSVDDHRVPCVTEGLSRSRSRGRINGDEQLHEFGEGGGEATLTPLEARFV